MNTTLILDNLSQGQTDNLINQENLSSKLPDFADLLKDKNKSLLKHLNSYLELFSNSIPNLRATLKSKADLLFASEDNFILLHGFCRRLKEKEALNEKCFLLLADNIKNLSSISEALNDLIDNNKATAENIQTVFAMPERSSEIAEHLKHYQSNREFVQKEARRDVNEEQYRSLLIEYMQNQQSYAFHRWLPTKLAAKKENDNMKNEVVYRFSA